jgi:transposase InsO family protein
MKTTTSTKTIEALRMIFCRTGIPKQIVSDNGPQFTSGEFENFTKQNGIKHSKSAPFHPATNGLVERFVQTFKNSMRMNVSLFP